MSRENKTLSLTLPNEEASRSFAAELAHCLFAPLCIYLQGPLGAGKTTLARALLHSLGYQGAVKSPSYALLEVYQFPMMQLCHFDLYRLAVAEELEFMGIRDYLGEETVCLFEWPQHGEGFIPVADLVLQLTPAGAGRQLNVTTTTQSGLHILQQLQQGFDVP